MRGVHGNGSSRIFLAVMHIYAYLYIHVYKSVSTLGIVHRNDRNGRDGIDSHTQELLLSEKKA